MFKWIWRIVGIIILLGVLLVLGTCYFQNCRKDTGPTLPPIDKAGWSVTIKATGEILFTNNYLKMSERSIYILHGYWEITKKKYVYRDIILPLDEAIFGPIEVKKR